MKTENSFILKSEHLAIGYAQRKHKQTIASDISFQLKKGELVGLVGANGIGKSTLLRTLTKLQAPLGGSILINEKPLNLYSSLELASILSVVLTEQLMSKNMSVKELVAIGRQPYTNWIGNLTENDKAIIVDAMTKTECLSYSDKKCYELSDGQLQKALIARALAQDTDIIMLDEPTTHLDMYHKASILKLLKNLANQTEKTIVFSTHEIDLAIQLCDRMIVMTEEGVYCDDPCKLIEQGIFDGLFPKDTIDFDPSIGRFKIKK